MRQETHKGANLYAYDAANRLVEVDGVAYAWDANGNLLSDGKRAYTYDHANRLISLSDPTSAYSYAYNGLGDRLQQTTNGVPTRYTLDLNAGLTQVLSDGTNAYLYGMGRIAQRSAANAYFLGDALGSVRQLADASGAILLSEAYEPYGTAMARAGMGASSYRFAGEWADATGLVHLRARYYQPHWGRFFQRDPWGGSNHRPQTINDYAYATNNPVLLMDPSGACVEPLSFVLCVTAAGTVIGVTTGVAYNVFVVQEKGGIENLPEMLNLSYYCDVDWKLALFSGGLGGLIGALTAATSGHAAEVLYRHAAEDALAREYGFKGRDELIRRAREKGLSLREYLLGWDTDIGGFKPEELEYARRIQQERGIELVRKRLSDAGNYDWVGSDGEFYDAMGIPEGGRSRPIDEQSNQFIKSLNEHLRNKQGPHGEPAYIPIFLEDVDQNAIDVIKRYIESLPESEQRRIIPWGFQ